MYSARRFTHLPSCSRTAERRNVKLRAQLFSCERFESQTVVMATIYCMNVTMLRKSMNLCMRTRSWSYCTTHCAAEALHTNLIAATTFGLTICSVTVCLFDIYSISRTSAMNDYLDDRGPANDKLEWRVCNNGMRVRFCKVPKHIVHYRCTITHGRSLAYVDREWIFRKLCQLVLIV